MARRVSIKSLARDLGVSHMTVSRALSGHPSVEPGTRARVLARAAAAQYERSPAAAALRGSATRILGLVVPGLLNEFYARLAHALSVQAAAQGYHLVTHLTYDDPGREALALRKLATLAAEAAAVVPAPGGATGADAGPAPLPLVHLVRRGAPGAPFVGIDDAPAIRAAVARLAGRGLRRLGYIGGPEATSTGRERRDAFLDGLRESGLTEAGLVRLGPPRAGFGRHAMADLLAAGAEGVVCGGVETAAGAVEHCLEAGVAVPGRLAFVGYGDPVAFRWLLGGVTAIALPVEEVAARTLARLTGSPDPLGAARAELVVRATA